MSSLVGTLDADAGAPRRHTHARAGLASLLWAGLPEAPRLPPAGKARARVTGFVRPMLGVRAVAA